MEFEGLRKNYRLLYLNSEYSYINIFLNLFKDPSSSLHLEQCSMER
jgi:hypothetical protein